MNYLLVEALERYHHFYGDALTVECPTGSAAHASPGRNRDLVPPGVAVPARCVRPSTVSRRRPPLRRRSTGGTCCCSMSFTATPAAAVAPATRTGWTALAARFIDEWARSTAAE